jgi:hypothetical protein
VYVTIVVVHTMPPFSFCFLFSFWVVFPLIHDRQLVVIMLSDFSNLVIGPSLNFNSGCLKS